MWMKDFLELLLDLSEGVEKMWKSQSVRSDLYREVFAPKSSVTEMQAGQDDSWGKQNPLNVDRKVLGSKVLSNNQKRWQIVLLHNNKSSRY